MNMPHATVAHMPHMHSETWTGASASSVYNTTYSTMPAVLMWPWSCTI